MKTKTLPPHYTVGQTLDVVAGCADKLAASLDADAPEAAIAVLNDLDEVAALHNGIATAAQAADVAAVAKVYHAAGFCRRFFPSDSLGWETAAVLDAAAVRLEQLINEAGV